MAYNAGRVAIRVTNDSGEDVSKANHFFPVDSVKTLVLPASDLPALEARRGLIIEKLKEVPDGPGELEVDAPFDFVADQDQHVTNRSPGPSFEDWTEPSHAESAAMPATNYGRDTELALQNNEDGTPVLMDSGVPYDEATVPRNTQNIKLETGALKLAQDNRIDIYAISGTGENGQIRVADVQEAIGRVDPLVVEPAHATDAALANTNADSKGREATSIAASAGSDTEPPVGEPGEVQATEAAKKFAVEHSVVLTDLTGTGKDGNITVDDVRNYVADLEVSDEHRAAIEMQKAVDDETPPPPEIEVDRPENGGS